MKKVILILLTLLTSAAFSQVIESRSVEDGINRLMNNPDFIKDVIDLGTSDLTPEKLDIYFQKYVPEYANFKVANLKSINFENLYFANTEGVTVDGVTQSLGKILNLNPAQANQFKDMLTGNKNYSPTSSNYSGDHTNMYERGNYEHVDYTVDYAVDFFQNEFGDGGTNSALIDLGGGLLGLAGNYFNQRYEEKLAAQKVIDDAGIDYFTWFQVGTSNSTTVPSNKNDLWFHGKADYLSTNASWKTSPVNYTEAIKFYDEAISIYLRNPERSFFLYQAYLGRAKSKVEMKAYKAAVIDFYFAERILKEILNGKLPDKSIGVIADQQEVKLGSLTIVDLARLYVARAYAKYRMNDFSGAIGDCEISKKMLNELLKDSDFINVSPLRIREFKRGDLNSLIENTLGLAWFGLKQYEVSYTCFSNSEFSKDLLGDHDRDGLIGFYDRNDKKSDTKDELVVRNYGLPDFFIYDIAQIRGLCLYKAKKTDEAINIYEFIQEAEADYGGKKLFTNVGGDISSVYLTLGNLHLANGNIDTSLSYFDKAIETKPTCIEYYLCRANCLYRMGDKKGGDRDLWIVRNPEKLQSVMKSELYYQTELQKMASQKKSLEQFSLLKEACESYPTRFFRELVISALAINDQNETKKVLGLYPEESIERLIIEHLYYRQVDSLLLEERALEEAVKKGLNFYSASTELQLRIINRPYYARIFLRYASKSNNNFIPEKFDYTSIRQHLDSTYAALEKGFTMNSLGGKHWINKKELEYSKSLGNYEEYMMLLRKDINLYRNPVYGHQVVECLIILGRKEEAIKFAKKVVEKGQMFDGLTNSIDNGIIAQDAKKAVINYASLLIE